MLRRATAGLVVLLALACAPSAFAATFTVTTNADSGVGSLRQAILDANGSPGVDVIDFNLTFSNSTITPVTSLPPVSGEVTFDGSAGGQQPRIDGSAVHGVGLQFTIPSAAQSTVRGLTITGFTTGLDLGTASMLATGNYIGTDSIGTPGLGNGVGITFAQASQVGGTTAAERNVISNNGTGIVVTGSGGTIEGNYIGPDPSGENALRGQRHRDHRQRWLERDDWRHGPGAGNVISGLSQNAIQLGTTTGDVIQGNVIGTTASQATVPGVDAGSRAGQRGEQQHDRRRRSRGQRHGRCSADVAIQVSGGTDNAIDRNFIGTDTGGTPFSTSNDEGVRIIGGSGNAFTNNRISSSNAQGIEIAGGTEHVHGQPHRRERGRRDHRHGRRQHDRAGEHVRRQHRLRCSGLGRQRHDDHAELDRRHRWRARDRPGRHREQQPGRARTHLGRVCGRRRRHQGNAHQRAEHDLHGRVLPQPLVQRGPERRGAHLHRFEARDHRQRRHRELRREPLVGR